MRLDQATAERVRALMADGESETAAYGRVISAGLDALESGDAAGRATSGTGDGAAVKAMGRTIDALTAQMAVKDEQIRALTRITEESQTITRQAQTLHAAQAAKAITDGAEGRRGLLARLLGRDKA